MHLPHKPNDGVAHGEIPRSATGKSSISSVARSLSPVGQTRSSRRPLGPAGVAFALIDSPRTLAAGRRDDLVDEAVGDRVLAGEHAGALDLPLHEPAGLAGGRPQPGDA